MVGPPGSLMTFLIALVTVVIETMGYLVANHHANSTVVKGTELMNSKN